MRRNRWLLSVTALLATVVGARPALSQGHPAAAAPASSAPPVTCAEGEVLLHGHCCATGADWVQAQHRCFAHNRRQALVLVVVSTAHGTLPSDVAATIDGTAMTGSPPSATTTPGAHAIQVTGTGFTTAQQSVTLAAGDVQRVEIALAPSVGGVRVNVTTDGAQVLLDGQPITGTPPSRSDVAPGPHHVEVSAAGHETVRGDVTVAAGETATLDIGELTVTPPPAPPSPPPASAAPPSIEQVITVTVTQPGQTFDVQIDTRGGHFHCATSVTQSSCTIRDVPAGSAHVTVTGDASSEDDLRIPVGPSTLTVDYQRSPIMRGVYGALGVACFVPTIVAAVATATCQSGTDACNAMPYVFVGLLIVPGIGPGVFLLASAARGVGTMTLRVAANNGTTSITSVSARRGWHDRRQSAIELLPVSNPGALFAF